MGDAMKHLVELAAARKGGMTPDGLELLKHAQAIVNSRSSEEAAEEPAEQADGNAGHESDCEQPKITVAVIDGTGSVFATKTDDPFKTFRDLFGTYAELFHPTPSAVVPAGTVCLVAEDGHAFQPGKFADIFEVPTYLGRMVPRGPILVMSIDETNPALLASVYPSLKEHLLKG